MKPDFARLLFFCSGILCLLGAGFIVGAYRIFPYQPLRAIGDTTVQTIRDWPVLTGQRPVYHLQPARQAGSGVTVNAAAAGQGDLVLVSSFFDGNPGLRLLRRDGTVVARWEAAFSEIFPDPRHLSDPPGTDWHTDLHGALMLPDGSVVFNFEYGGLVKLDRCGAPVWRLAYPTHHSVVRAAAGGFWVPGRRLHGLNGASPYPPFPLPFSEDTLLHVSGDGKVLREIPVPEIFRRNGLEALLTAAGHKFERGMIWDEEIVHLNKIAELPPALAGKFPMFAAGDLLLSFRTLNLLMVIDPETLAVKWRQTGPWLRQHDPHFAPGGRIVLFNNNIFETAFAIPGLSPPAQPGVSNVMAVDPATGEVRVLWGGRDGQRLLSVIRGKADPRPGGGLLVAEFEAGRAFETDAAGNVVWEYVNRYDENWVVEITDAHAYPAGYFTVADWSCPVPG